MKILMINVVCGIRSTGRICTDLAEELENQGHTVKIAYGREKVPEKYKKYAIRIGNDLDVIFHGLKARLFDASGWGSRRTTECFIKWLKTYDPDVIHLHNLHGYYINIEILFDYLKSSNKRIIWTLHDCWAFTGHGVYCDTIKCKKWLRGCNHCPHSRKYPKSYMDRSKHNWEKKREIFLGASNLQIITPSKWLASLAKQSFLSDYKIKVIHNGIDTSRFYPLKSDFRQYYGLEESIVLLGVASRWTDLKGYYDYIKLSEILDERYRIVLVGVSKKQKERLPRKVIGIEQTNNTRELSMIYSESDLFLNLTYCDNYPSVNLEALSCGLYVISYDTGGCSESLSENTGAVIEKGDIEMVCKIIERTVKEGTYQNPGVHSVRDKKDTTADYILEYDCNGEVYD